MSPRGRLNLPSQGANSDKGCLPSALSIRLKVGIQGYIAHVAANSKALQRGLFVAGKPRCSPACDLDYAFADAAAMDRRSSSSSSSVSSALWDSYPMSPYYSPPDLGAHILLFRPLTIILKLLPSH